MDSTWDLRHTYLRNIMNNQQYISKLYDNINNLLQKKLCQQNIRIIFIHTMPYPMCYISPEGEIQRDCLADQYYRTNSAIETITQSINKKLLLLNYNNLIIINTLSIMNSNLNIYDCMNHFLCRHGEKQKFRIAESKSGLALVNEMLYAMCEPLLTSKFVES